MISLGKRRARYSLLIGCLAVLACATYGCGSKDPEATKPASGGEYYKGEMDKKPAGATAPKGKMTIDAPPGKPQ